jgi:CAP-Gly domain-containing linker protein 1
MRKLSQSSASPAKFCRQRSDLSDVSMLSTTSSKMTPAAKGRQRSISSIQAPERLKTTIKEKDQKIEQLMKERNLERAQIAKAALQTDEAEGHLHKMNKDFVSYKGQAQDQLKELQAALVQSEKELKEVRVELDDEQKKTEDLQFKIEEDEVMRGDSNIEEQLLANIKTLEDQLKAEAKKANTEFEVKIKTLETELGIERKVSADHNNIVDQLNSLTLELEAQRTNAREVQEEAKKVNEALIIKSNELESLQDELSNKTFEAEEQITILNVTLEATQKDLKEAKDGLEREKAKLTSMNDNLKNQNDSSGDKINGLEKTLSDKDDKIIELQHKLETSEKSGAKLQVTLEEKAEEFKAKAQEGQELKSSLARLETELKAESDLVSNIQGQVQEATKVSEDLGAQVKATKAEAAEGERNLQAKIKEVEEFKAQSEKSGSETQKELRKKTQELISSSTKLTQASDLIESFKVKHLKKNQRH